MDAESSNFVNKKIVITLWLVATVSMWAGYVIGEKHNPETFESMNFLLTSDRNLETIQNMKALEGLRENRVETIIEFMQLRVKFALQREGIEKSTLERAKQYQKKYCKAACLGME